MTDKLEDVQFLAEEFDIPAPRAAALVTSDEQEAERLAKQQRDHALEANPNDGEPVPLSPDEHDVPNDGGLQKEVLERDNERGRAGS
jgi:hypothetical protein